MAISERPDITDESTPSKWDGQRMTLDEFLALPEQKPALEYVDGVVTQKLAPTADHVELQALLRQVFNETAEPRRLGRTFTEPRFRPRQPVQALQGDDRIDVDDVLPGVSLTVRQLFDMILPNWVAEVIGRDDASEDAEEGHS